MRSLETFNKGLVALHSWDSNMSMDELSEEELDARIKVACLQMCNAQYICNESVLLHMPGCKGKV